MSCRIACLLASSLLAAIVSAMSAMRLAAVMAPPIYTGCVSMAETIYIWRLFVRKASVTPWPILSSAPVTLGSVTPSMPPRFVPMLFSVLFCVLLRIEISLLENIAPPITSRCGRYFVRAALRVCSAMVRCTFDAVSVLLFPSAIARQLSSVSVCCAIAGTAIAVSANIDKNLFIFIIVLFFRC